MKKLTLTLIIAFFCIPLLFVSTTTLSGGHGPPKEWKGEGTKIEFQSMPTMTVKDFLNGKMPEKTETISGTLKFPANAPKKNAPVVVVMHGMGGISVWEEHWLKTFDSIGLATFMVDSNWGRRNCKKEFKKSIKGLWCSDVNQGMNRIIDGYRALELLSKHSRIDPTRIGCLGISLGAKGCLYLNVKRFQEMWGTPGIEFAASVPLYPPCDVRFKEDDVISNTPIRIHVGELDTYFPVDSCVDYVQLLRSKEKDVEIKVYPGAHHGFDADPSSIFRGKTKMVIGGYNAGRCYFEENTDLTEEQLGEGFVQQITQVGFNEWQANASKKEKKKLFKYMKSGNKRGYNNPFVIFDESCVSNSTTIAYDKDASKEATKLIKDFFTSTFKL
jgi:dienelactone hydrolase